LLSPAPTPEEAVRQGSQGKKKSRSRQRIGRSRGTQILKEDVFIGVRNDSRAHRPGRLRIGGELIELGWGHVTKKSFRAHTKKKNEDLSRFLLPARQPQPVYVLKKNEVDVAKNSGLFWRGSGGPTQANIKRSASQGDGPQL